MCKNMMIAGIKPGFATQEKLWDFMIAAAPFMNAGDRDGLGYVAQNSKGLWGERWLVPSDAWKYRKEWTAQDEAVRNNFKGTLMAEPRFNRFGEINYENVADTHAVLYHARMATCEKNLANVHPFVRGNTALIHNGVIRNASKLKNITSTCDSEVILNQYVDLDVANNPDKIKELAESLEGYYACGVLTTGADGRQYMDIFRNPTAPLYAYYVQELEAVVFCTAAEIVRNACYQMKWKFSSTFRFTDEVMIRLDAKTGELISTHKFKAGWGQYRGGHGSSGRWDNTKGWETNDYNSKVGGSSTKDPGDANVIPMGMHEEADSDGKKKDNMVQDVVTEIATQTLIEMKRAGHLSTSTISTNDGKPCSTEGSISCKNKADMTLEEKLSNPFYYEAEGFNGA